MSSGPTFLPPVNDRAKSRAVSKRQNASTIVAAHTNPDRPGAFNGSELKDPLGIGLEKRFLVRIRERHGVPSPPHFLSHILIRIVHGIEHAIGADDRAS